MTGSRIRDLVFSVLLLVAAAWLVGCASAPSGSAPAGPPEAAGVDAAGEATSHLMVTLRPAPPGRLDTFTRELAETYGIEPVAAWQIQSLDRRCVVFGSRTPLVGRRLDTLLRALRADPRIDLAQSVQPFSTLAEAGGGSYRHLQHNADTLHLEAAHRMATGRGVKVAIVDTGMDLTHPELRARILQAKDFAARRLVDGSRGKTSRGDAQGGEDALFTRDLHGTAVAGVLAAADDGAGILGVAPAAGILALKACWPQSPGDRQARCDSYTLSLALDFALTAGAQVINLSWSGPPDPILEALVLTALDRGTVVVAALGAPGTFPGHLPGLIAVRSLETEAAGVPAAAVAALAAPGDEILSTVPGGGYDFFSGSSLAAAEVSGVVALLLEKKPDLGPAGVADLLRRTARDNPGQAAVDACAPLAALLGSSCDR